MPTYKSLFEVQGAVGEAQFRKANGKNLVGKKSSVSASRIMNGKEFQRTRENMSEFAGSAVTGKAMRTGLASVVARFKDSRLTARLTAVFNRICRQAVTGARGQRPIELLANASYLQAVELVRDTPLSSSFVAPYSVTVAPGRDAATLSVPVFVYDGLLKVPDGATHWRMVLAVAAVSDHMLDVAENKYLPVAPTLNAIGSSTNGAWETVAVQLGAPISLTASLPGAPVMTNDAALVVCVGVEFAQWTTGTHYILAQYNAMQVQGAF